ncbi:B3/B4 domain-containing protein [Qaidamihabitans albus]|uniref:B3/B4 domain-containing protein n=1 Tax=Qaidamihabitans albus TaxID=2795733 RepID=UPI0018F1A6AA|nr:phenylalanine--tRNA ligase beta subunit-related protein [Qaidamihabitans albus]
MYVEHSSEIWAEFPELVACALLAHGVDASASVADRVAPYYDTAASRLRSASEGELPEIQAWRRAFSHMGLKPTQYRCAAESLLRRFRKERSLPKIHPVIDICNAISMSFAIPIAVFDVAEVVEHIEVRHARGDETYLAFSGEVEHPEPREVVFADASNQAHARRWTNRQALTSAVRPSTRSVLVVAEAMHSSAPSDVPRLLKAVDDELAAVGGACEKSAVLSASSPRVEF